MTLCCFIFHTNRMASPQLYHRSDEISYSFISLQMYLAADCATAITDAAAASATAVAVATTTVQRYSDYKTQPFLYRIIRSMVHILNTARLNLSNNIR